MRIRSILAVFSLLLAFGTPAFARGTLDSILPQIRAQHPGRLSDADPWTDADGNTHYRIKWMTPEGRILYFDADTRTGRYSSARGDETDQWRDHRFDGDHWNGNRDDRRDHGGQDNNGHRDHWNGDEGGPDRGGQDRHGGSWGGPGDDWRGGGNGGDNASHHHHGH